MTAILSHNTHLHPTVLAASAAFDLTSLIDRRCLFPDTNQDGYGDEVALRMVVPKHLTHASIWAGALNLAARLCFEVTAFTPPIIHTRLKPSSNGYLLSIDLCDPRAYSEDPNTAMLLHEGSGHLILRSGSPETLADALLTLATASFREKVIRSPSERFLLFHRRKEPAHGTPVSAATASTVSLVYRPDIDPKQSASANRLDAWRTGPLKSFVDTVPPKKPRLPAVIDLLDVTQTEGFYAVDSDTPRHRRLTAAVRIDPNGLSSELALGLADMVCRMALAATEIPLPLVVAGHVPNDRIPIDIRETDDSIVEIRRMPASVDTPEGIRMQGPARELAKAVRLWTGIALAEDGPDAAEAARFRNRVQEFVDLVSGRGLRGRWAHALAGFKPEPNASFPMISPDQMPWIEKACTALGLPFPVVHHPKPIRRRVEWLSESNALLSWLYGFPKGSGKLRVVAQLSKPLMERRITAYEMARMLGALGYEADIQIVNAYKPGLSWLVDIVLRKLLSLRESIATVRIEYRPFEPESTALETRSRWVQELFPGQDLLARELELPLERIRLEENPDLVDTYVVTAWNDAGEERLRESFSPITTRMCYITAGADGPWIHPTTGAVRITEVTPTNRSASDSRPNGDFQTTSCAPVVLLDKVFPTDREWFWKMLQEQWLPLMEAEMIRRLQEGHFEEALAFWEEIRINVSIEETDERLFLDEERVCPMEALHEDIYFGLLDWYASFAERYHLPQTLQLGKIVPHVVSRMKGSSPSARLYLKPMAWPAVPKTDCRPVDPTPIVSRILLASDRWDIWLKGAPCSDDEKRSRLLRIAQAWGIEADGDASGWCLRTVPPVMKRLQPQQRPTPPKKPLRPPGVRTMLKAEEVSRWMKRLTAIPLLTVWPCGTSIQGRTIWAIEACDAGSGSVRSVAKLRCLKPTLLFNARHHANEVSSTTAVIRMALKTAQSQWGKSCLQRMNVVWIPLENPDGVATLETLLPNAPDHKLHAARYNAVGSEFYRDYFADPPRFPEAAAKKRIWERWLPVLMVDHHGFPSHEWDQPFAGIAPYRFRNFWLPMTGLYLIVPFFDDPKHPLHETALGMYKRLNEAMVSEKHLVNINRIYRDRFRRYAYTPDPATFDPPSDAPLPTVPLEDRLVQTNFAVRYPHITACEIIVEAADEIVSGYLLAQCVRGHERIEEVLMDILS